VIPAKERRGGPYADRTSSRCRPPHDTASTNQPANILDFSVARKPLHPQPACRLTPGSVDKDTEIGTSRVSALGSALSTDLGVGAEEVFDTDVPLPYATGAW
jgi:hypothetical protein